jgi:ATP-dependent helicase Lhr and Lhr-like helicase
MARSRSWVWAGDLVSNTLLVQLRSTGLFGLSFGVGLWIEGIDPSGLESRLNQLGAGEPIDAADLAQTIPNRRIDRYDCFLPEDLLSRNYASAELDIEMMLEAVRIPRK